ncbi:MAG TPA: hypothetical protein O0Y06_00395 [Methanocorpusculum sp.]|nr:hypothetical protein [Methanocorpusculum sp.]HJK79345.1 hypothetical protein [Methanocorpusculum sp.]
MPTTRELGSESYEEERKCAIRRITDRILEVATEFADENLNAEQLAELVNEIEGYSSESRREEKATAYDQGLLRGAKYSVSPNDDKCKSNTEPTEKKSLSQIMKDNESDFLSFCTAEGKAKITRTKAIAYKNAVIKHCDGVTQPSHLAKYQYQVEGKKGVYPPDNAKKGVSKLFDMLRTIKEVESINGYGIDRWILDLRDFMTYESAVKAKLIKPALKIPHEVNSTEIAEWYNELPDRYRGFFYLLVMSGGRMETLHKFLSQSKEYKMNKTKIIRKNDPDNQIDYDNAICGDVLRMDVSDFGGGSKDAAFLFAPAEAYDLVINTNAADINSTCGILAARCKPEKLNERRRQRQGSDYTGDYTLKSTRKFTLNYLIAKYVPDILSERQVNLIQSRGVSGVDTKSYYDMRKQLTISYSKIVDDFKTILPLPPAP